jgi:hypothetical protein
MSRKGSQPRRTLWCFARECANSCTFLPSSQPGAIGCRASARVRRSENGIKVGHLDPMVTSIHPKCHICSYDPAVFRACTGCYLLLLVPSFTSCNILDLAGPGTIQLISRLFNYLVKLLVSIHAAPIPVNQQHPSIAQYIYDVTTELR